MARGWPAGPVLLPGCGTHFGTAQVSGPTWHVDRPNRFCMCSSFRNIAPCLFFFMSLEKYYTKTQPTSSSAPLSLLPFPLSLPQLQIQKARKSVGGGGRLEAFSRARPRCRPRPRRRPSPGSPRRLPAARARRIRTPARTRRSPRL